MQILYNIGMILKSLAVAVGKLLFLLLIRLYLIIPVLYILAIWIASLCVPFSLGSYSTFLIVGVTLCVALSALLVLRRAMLVPAQKKQRATGVLTAGSMETRPQEEITAEEPEIPETAPAASTYAESTVAPPAPEPYRPEPIRPVTVQEEIRSEQPRYFRTKRDPSLYIAEYSDRLEYFRRMEDGTYRYLDTEMKQ